MLYPCVEREEEMEDKHRNRRELFVDRDPYIFVLKTFFNRWKPFIIRAIGFDKGTRFNKFTKQLPISAKVLTSNLRELKDDGIIERIEYPEIPPRVEYRLTELGESICPILDTLYDWGWREMKRRKLPVDPLGEMWHGYSERDEDFMDGPHK